MKYLDQLKSSFPHDIGELSRGLRAYEQAQGNTLRSLGALNAVEREMAIYESNNIAAHIRAMEQQRLESLRAVLDPLETFRKTLGVDPAWKRMIDELTKPLCATEQWTERSGVESFMKLLRESSSGLSAVEHARETYATANVAMKFVHEQKAFKEAQRNWKLPRHLVESVGALSALQEQIGTLTLPVIDWESAATLARMLGERGIQEELASLGIGENGELGSSAFQTGDDGYLTPKQRDLLTILSLILALLVPIYQEWSSNQSIQPLTTQVESNAVLLERQAKQLESLSILVERALVKETLRSQTRFVVLERVATVRLSPRAGASIEGKLLPREVVTLVSEEGKWIEIRYFHWVLKEYQTGWVLKKYFTRVPASYQSKE